ncbi:hypothetical protein RHGRI_029808 [Rhododendron griersonianum]|uniref:DNA topoisomerase (ATP-hydrolyzing) n=1 Tax=Rhododendron griersonianum TaxID=479676 RepID=A0AAV6IRP8_9ERIC|nr:hypothetical protein RHGRI_029808 [Rhododendron griersonianum]
MILKATGKTSSGKMNKMGKQLSLPSARRKLKQERIGSDTLRFEPGTYLDQKEKLIKYSDFVNKELILFSMADLQRSIPSITSDGQSIERTWYMPMIPMLVVNGSEGIKIGWSSNILNYSSRDIVANILYSCYKSTFWNNGCLQGELGLIRDLFLHSADRYRKACDNPIAIVGEALLTVLIDEKTAGMSLVPNSNSGPEVAVLNSTGLLSTVDNDDSKGFLQCRLRSFAYVADNSEINNDSYEQLFYWEKGEGEYGGKDDETIRCHVVSHPKSVSLWACRLV